MLLEIKVIPNARKNEIKQEGDTYKVYIAVPAVNGKANKKLVELLSEHFQVRKSSIFIKTGKRSHYKIMEIMGRNNGKTGTTSPAIKKF